jgi:hypothetical protein
VTTTDDAITERIPLSRSSDALPGRGPVPRVHPPAWRRARLVVVAVVVAVLAAGTGAFVGLVVLPPAPPESPALPVAAVGPGVGPDKVSAGHLVDRQAKELRGQLAARLLPQNQVTIDAADMCG